MLSTPSITVQSIANQQRGFNLIEAAIVLAIVGLVIGGIWVAASMAFDSLKAQNTSKGILTLSEKLRALYTSVPSTTAVDSMAALISSKTIPEDWENGATEAKSPYGGAVTVAGTVGATTVSLAGLTQSQCSNLVTRIANSRPSAILRSINAGGTAVTNGGAGTLGFGSVTAASGNGACAAAANNTLVFTFDLTQ